MGLLRNRDDQLIVGEHRQLAVLLIAPDAIEPVRQPIGKREVDRFVEVELVHTTKDRSAGARSATTTEKRTKQGKLTP